MTSSLSSSVIHIIEGRGQKKDENKSERNTERQIFCVKGKCKFVPVLLTERHDEGVLGVEM
jgi:hypothetical protein